MTDSTHRPADRPGAAASLADASPAPLFVIQEHRLRYVNRAFAGIDASALVGRASSTSFIPTIARTCLSATTTAGHACRVTVAIPAAAARRRRTLVRQHRALVYEGGRRSSEPPSRSPSAGTRRTPWRARSGSKPWDAGRRHR
jgi:hypothetical protein